MWRFLCAILVLAATSGAANAQLALPGAADASSPPPPPAIAAAPAKRAAPRAPVVENRLAEMLGHPLRLNGVNGELTLSIAEAPEATASAKAKAFRKGTDLRIDKLTMIGEVISHPDQKCSIQIVSDAPITARSVGAPEGLPRYVADIPACPLTFDLVEGGALAPAQTTACVFQAADCQAIPSGLWGPEPAALADQARKLVRERALAERSILASLKTLEKADKRIAPALHREQSDFAGQRDDLCRDYAGESQHGFCDTALTEARAALLRKRAAASRKASEDKDE